MSCSGGKTRTWSRQILTNDPSLVRVVILVLMTRLIHARSPTPLARACSPFGPSHEKSKKVNGVAVYRLCGATKRSSVRANWLRLGYLTKRGWRLVVDTDGDDDD